MTEVPPTLAAVHFRAPHSIATVGGGSDSAVERRKKAGPAGPAFEFPFSLEERLTTSGALESTWPMFGQKRT
jgi:hypothetical protein